MTKGQEHRPIINRTTAIAAICETVASIAYEVLAEKGEDPAAADHGLVMSVGAYCFRMGMDIATVAPEWAEAVERLTSEDNELLRAMEVARKVTELYPVRAEAEG